MDIHENVHIDRFSGSRHGTFFLTHWHSDHIKGLTRRWSKGDIYCSHKTREVLLRVMPFIDDTKVHALRLYRRTKLKDMYVTFYDANHIAGSIMLYLEINGEKILYTSDYRYKVGLMLPRCVDTLFLDGTFQEYNAALPTLFQSAYKVNIWLSQVLGTYQHVYIGYFHVGTCQLLQELHNTFGYSFYLQQSNMTEEEYNICHIMYNEIWKPDSRIILIPIHKRDKTTSLPTPILLPSSQWYLHSHIDLKKGEYRAVFTTHSDRVDNNNLIRLLKPKRFYFL